MKQPYPEDLIYGKKDKTLSLRINEDLYFEAEALYAKMGLPLSTAINDFLQQSVNSRGMPFALSESLESYVRTEAAKQLKKQIEQGLDSGVRRGY